MKALLAALVLALAGCAAHAAAIPAGNQQAETARVPASCALVHKGSEWYTRMVIPGPASAIRLTVYGTGKHQESSRVLPYPKIPARVTATLLYDYAGPYADPVPVTCSAAAVH